MPDLKRYGNLLGRGVTATFAPSVIKGVLLGFFRTTNVTTEKATEWVLADKSLWDSLDPESQRRFRQMASKIGNVRWMTVNWAIDSLRDEFPALASLFLGWTKGRNWLARQVERWKAEIQG